MSASNPEPRWPAWGHDRQWAWRLESIEPLCTVTEDYLRRGELHSVGILDADLKLFTVADARELGRAGLFGWRPGFKGTYLHVEPVFQFERQLDLEAAKKYVLEFVSAHPSVYNSGMPRSELLSMLMSAKSSAELFAAL